MEKLIALFITLISLHSFAIAAEPPEKTQTRAEYSAYLDSLLEDQTTPTANDRDSSTNAFYQRSWGFWMAHLDSYHANPGAYQPVLQKYYQLKDNYQLKNTFNPQIFEDVIESYRRFDRRNTLPSNPFLFVGSSSIVYWETARAFTALPVVNRGFGGASMKHLLHHYDDVIKPHNPKALVLYCDIDIETGESPKVVIDLYKTLIAKVEQDFPKAHIVLLSMKPTLVDHLLGPHILRNKNTANTRLKALSEEQDNRHFINVGDSLLQSNGRVNAEYFLPDGMHLNERGYQQWNPLVIRVLEQLKEN